MDERATTERTPPALESGPREVDTEERLLHAKVLVEVGELYDAEAEVAEVLDRRPDDLNVLSLFAKIKHMRGQLSEAVACWAQLHARTPHNEAALLRLGSMLELAKDPERGAGEFLAFGQHQLWRKPASHLELEGVFHQFLARRPDDARASCDRLARKYRSSDSEMYKLAVLAKAWISELSGDVEGACRILEELGGERGFETDVDRVALLVRVYETLGSPEQIWKAVHICQYLERSYEKISVLGRLASLYGKLGQQEAVSHYEQRYLEAFRRRMHRPSFAEAVRAAARRYVPLEKLRAVTFADTVAPAEPSLRERAISLALDGQRGAARELLQAGPDPIDRKYLADLAALDGDLEGAGLLYIESLGERPRDVRVLGWLVDHHARTGSRAVEEFFRRPGTSEEARYSLEAARRAAPLRPSVWRHLASLHHLLGHDHEKAVCAERASALEAAAERKRGTVGRVLAAAVYHFLGKAKGLTHEVWAARRPAQTGRGGFLEEILGNLTPEMKDGVRNTFMSVREYARSKLPQETADILDYNYTYKVTKEDEPSGGLSAGLPSALAFLSVFLNRPVPQDVACTGVLITDSHDVLVLKRVGEPEFKVRGAYNRNLRMLILPEGNRDDLRSNAQVPPAVCDQIVRYAHDLDQAVTLTFGADVWG
jgi:tetratricopeptide (TPR) repeat protein